MRDHCVDLTTFIPRGIHAPDPSGMTSVIGNICSLTKIAQIMGVATCPGSYDNLNTNADTERPHMPSLHTSQA